MKLVHPILEKPIEFSENIINVLVIENQNLFTKLINELFQQTSGLDGDFVFSKENKQIDCTKAIEILFNIFEIDINCKKIISKLYNQLSKNATDEENYLNMLDIKGKIIKYIDSVCSTEMYQLKYSTEFDISGIFKLFDIKFESNYESIVEKIINYLSVSYEIFRYDCFIFVNLKSFLSNEDLQKLYQYVQYNKLNLLLLESTLGTNKNECEKILIIDNDICII